MGHTVSSQRQVCDNILQELTQFKKSLRQKDRDTCTKLLNSARNHYGSISYTSSYHTWAIVLLSMMLEQQKEIESLQSRSV